MLKIPDQFSGIRIQRNSGVRIESLVEWGEPTAQKIPRLRLGHAPVGEIEIGIVTSRQPRVRSSPVVHRQAAPCFAAGLPFARNGVEAPYPLPGVDVECGNITALAVKAGAPGQSH